MCMLLFVHTYLLKQKRMNNFTDLEKYNESFFVFSSFNETSSPTVLKYQIYNNRVCMFVYIY